MLMRVAEASDWVEVADNRVTLGTAQLVNITAMSRTLSTGTESANFSPHTTAVNWSPRMTRLPNRGTARRLMPRMARSVTAARRALLPWACSADIEGINAAPNETAKM